MQWLELPTDESGLHELVLQLTFAEVRALIHRGRRLAFTAPNPKPCDPAVRPFADSTRAIYFDAWCTITDPDY